MTTATRNFTEMWSWVSTIEGKIKKQANVNVNMWPDKLGDVRFHLGAKLKLPTIICRFPSLQCKCYEIVNDKIFRAFQD